MSEGFVGACLLCSLHILVSEADVGYKVKWPRGSKSESFFNLFLIIICNIKLLNRKYCEYAPSLP